MCLTLWDVRDMHLKDGDSKLCIALKVVTYNKLVPEWITERVASA